MMTTELVITPAGWPRRLAALFCDYALLGIALWLISTQQPSGPPPADAMSFYTAQDFKNYFSLVGYALCLCSLAFLLVLTPLRSTLGQALFRLRLVALDGNDVTIRHVTHRWRVALATLIFIMVPGPVIALLIGAVTAAILSVPFSTSDAVLRQAGIPDALRLAAHGLSFLALILALWHGLIRRYLLVHKHRSAGLTRLDRRSESTHVAR
ncbi:MAG: RDD family protein [Pseudomonadota bacterium]